MPPAFSCPFFWLAGRPASAPHRQARATPGGVIGCNSETRVRLRPQIAGMWFDKFFSFFY
jgi:hypothetical protein